MIDRDGDYAFMSGSNDASGQTQGRTFLDRLTSVFHEGELRDRAAVLDALTDARTSGVLDDETFSMMEGALAVSDIRAADLMVPRAQVSVVDFSEPRDVWLRKLIDSGHSRLPVVDNDMDNVLGILHAKDLLQILVVPDVDPKSLLRSARFIPETQPINVLFRDFKETRNHLALVIDEFGGISGLITIEDVLEQIVGDISDEFDHDDEAGNIVGEDENHWRVRALTPIEQFNEYFGSDLSDPYCETIGGLVTDRFEHVPHTGEVIEEAGFRFRILGGDDRQARLLSVERIKS